MDYEEFVQKWKSKGYRNIPFLKGVHFKDYNNIYDLNRFKRTVKNIIVSSIKEKCEEQDEHKSES